MKTQRAQSDANRAGARRQVSITAERLARENTSGTTTMIRAVRNTLPSGSATLIAAARMNPAAAAGDLAATKLAINPTIAPTTKPI